ncbi:acyl-CoA thioesterase [Nonomuraea sp. NPDC050556]|uniref:acyl-CoA thioesterase n=1 Tax=Nonomuraea sp. NPDC050556 TaxID=3364369 RepID=UPI0037A4BA2C
MRTYDYRHLVTFEETNLVGNVYFTNYLLWQGHARERFLAEHAPGVVRDLSDGLALVTVSCNCDFFAELFALDTVEVRMRLAAVEETRVSMSFAYFRVADGLPELVARGGQTIGCARRTPAGVEPVPVPAELLDALRPYAEGRGPG